MPSSQPSKAPFSTVSLSCDDVASIGAMSWPIKRFGLPGGVILCCLSLSAPGSATGSASGAPARAAGAGSTSGTPAVETLFVEAGEAAGLDFRHRGARDGSLWLPEITGSGLALFDADGDGDLDVYLVQSGDVDPEVNRRDGQGDRLYRNRSVAGGELRFEDVSEQAGVAAFGFGMGVAAGDLNNDGSTDLYVANLGPNALLLNEGGRFRDVVDEAGADDDRWSVGASIVDLDGDGWLDVYVVNYLSWSPSRVAECFAPSTRRDYCGPTAYPPVADRLLRNRGDGTFEPIAAGSFEASPAPGLGVATADFDHDGRLDVFVANDGAANQLWLQREGLRFEEAALLAGLAVNGSGVPEASMGVAVADFDGNGFFDVLLTHLSAESNTLYAGRGEGFYEDVTSRSGLGPPSLPHTAFGVDWLEANGDGVLDLVVANGAVRLHDAGPGADHGLGQPNQLFVARGDGRFEERSDQMPASFRAAETSRGLAVGDLDDDGDLDFVVSNNSGPPRVYLRPGAPDRERVLALRVVEGAARRDALGAVVTVRLEDDAAPLVGRVHSDGSYASSRDPRLLFELPRGASVAAVRALEVRWADGTVETFSATELAGARAASSGVYLTLVRGTAGR